MDSEGFATIELYEQNDPRIGRFEDGKKPVYPQQTVTGTAFEPKYGGYTTRFLEGSKTLFVVVPPAFNPKTKFVVQKGDYNKRDEQQKREVKPSSPSSDKS